MVAGLEVSPPVVEDAVPARRSAWLIWPAAAVSAVLVWFGTGLEPIPWLTWLAPFPMLLWAARASGRTAAAAGFAAWAAGSLNVWSYYVGTLEVPLVVVVGFLALQALAFGGVVALYRALLLRRGPVAAVLAAPALWAGIEYLVSLFSPGGSFSSIGYTQAEVPPVIQLVSVTGVWGVSFLLIAVPAIAAAMVSQRRAWRPLLPAAAVLVLAVGGYALWRSPPAGPVTTVALVDVRQTQDSLPMASPEAGRVLEAYLDQVPVVAGAGADVVVLPEKVFKVSAAELEELGRQMNSAAAKSRITIVVGLTLKDAAGVHNIAMAYTAQSAVRYDKQHLVTGWEDHFTAGDRLVSLPGSSMGLAICKDLDHPEFGRGYGALGTTVLLVPALDFDRDGRLHSRIAVVRGVENGMAVVRSAGRGRLVAAEPNGRLVIDAVTGSGTTVGTAALRSGSGATPYTLLGDGFAWSCLVFVVAVGLLRRRW
jgi:apolipoprotein N-acyltransferase